VVRRPPGEPERCMYKKRNKMIQLFYFSILFLLITAVPVEHCKANENSDLSHINLSVVYEKKYKEKAARTIMKHWLYKANLSNVYGLQTDIVFKVMANGEIKDIFISKPSGDLILDESAVKAIQMANPLKPFPETIDKSSIDICIKFNPRE
jgi:TonB family protein